MAVVLDGGGAPVVVAESLVSTAGSFLAASCAAASLASAPTSAGSRVESVHQYRVKEQDSQQLQHTQTHAHTRTHAHKQRERETEKNRGGIEGGGGSCMKKRPGHKYAVTPAADWERCSRL